MTERATKVFNSTNPLVHAALTRLAPIALGRSAVQDKAAPRLGQIAATYRDCPIAKGGCQIGRLRAGDRVPDFELTAAAGENRRLYDMLDLSTLTLFVTGGAGRIADAHRPWDDILTVHRVSTAADPVGAGPGWLLVRPDGYLAAAGGPGDAETLRRWLDRWLIPRSG